MAAAFVEVTNDDLDGDWALPVHETILRQFSLRLGFEVKAMTAIEVPDLPPFAAWQQWMMERGSPIAVCRAALPEFLEHRGRDALFETAKSLYERGRPSLLWMRIFVGPEGVALNQVDLDAARLS